MSYKKLEELHKMEVNDLLSTLSALRAENARLREALNIYADESLWIPLAFRDSVAIDAYQLTVRGIDINRTRPWEIAAKALKPAK